MNQISPPPSQAHTQVNSRREPNASTAVLTTARPFSALGAEAMAALKRTHVLPRLVGSVLVAAALLKTYQFVAPPPSEEPLWITFLLVAVEVFCGLGLVTQWFPRSCRIASLVLFACFLAVALAKALSGAQSCACLGSVTLSPWLAVIFDVFALAALTGWQPTPTAPAPASNALRRIATLVLLAAVPIFAWAVYPAQASSLVAEPLTNLGVLRQGQPSSFDLILRNPSNRTIVVDSLETSCPCLAPRLIPVAIPPEGEVPLSMELDLRKEPAFTGRLQIQVEGRDPSRQKLFQTQVTVDVQRSGATPR